MMWTETYTNICVDEAFHRCAGAKSEDTNITSQKILGPTVVLLGFFGTISIKKGLFLFIALANCEKDVISFSNMDTVYQARTRML